jgi:1-acyl-sn-glycerol-3-phosphate acyltransferase
MAPRARPSAEKTALWRFLAGILVPLLNSVGRYRIHHLEHIPATGAFVLTPNHVTNVDPLISAYVMWKAGRMPRFLAKASLFRVPVFGGLLRITGQVPVERASGGSDSLLAAGRLIAQDRGVIVYPEGTLTRDPDEWPMRGKTGAARLALLHDIPVIPMGHWGAQRILPRYSSKISLFPRKRVEILIGEPVDLAPWKGRSDPAALTEATRAVMQAITALVEELRAETAPPERWDPAEHGQPEFGRRDP